MRKACVFILMMIWLTSCANNNNANENDEKAAQPVIVQKHEVSEERKTVNPKPAAVYSEKLSGEAATLNNWKFAVSLFETAKTFTYVVKIKYEEIDIEDSLRLPDLGVMPKPALQKGTDEHSCIIGFMDDKNTFREYKLVKVNNDNVHISTLKSYSVGHYDVK